MRLEDLETKICSELFNFRKLSSREEKVSAVLLKVEDLLTLGLLYTSEKFGKTLFAGKSYFRKKMYRISSTFCTFFLAFL